MFTEERRLMEKEKSLEGDNFRGWGRVRGERGNLPRLEVLGANKWGANIKPLQIY